ncbi:xylulokinase [Aquipuribacter sp. MA13-6]|uniref:xylulokinase n=1 Tax=unclassified Aquipuribacter TaxID=2635084 RepID=UPI003EEE71E1
MALVAGVDSSTQSCKVVVRDAATGALVRTGRAPHPDGTEVHPDRWWDALQAAVADAGGLDDVDAVSVGGQQHGLVALGADGQVLRPALLWNDTRSAAAAADLVRERGAQAWADDVGVVPVASFTVAKLRWLRDAEPDVAAQVAAVCLPHDWLTWRLAGGGEGGSVGLDALVTDRGDASGTGYFSAATGEYRRDLLEAGLGHDARLPRVLGPAESGGAVGVDLVRPGALLGPGSGDNAAAALGVGAGPGDVVVSIGTSGVVSGISDVAANDPSGVVAGFADATGRFLPLVCTLNAARVLDATARLLGVDHDGLARLALQAPAGADGLVLVPYLEGERTPNLPDATGSLHGLTLTSTTPAHLARAAFEGLFCGLAAGIDALVEQGVDVRRVVLVGGAAASPATHAIAPAVLGCPVVVPPPSEYVADGAARQAAWVLSGGAEPPAWRLQGEQTVTAEATPQVRERYAVAADKVVDRL